jgi:peptide-methionine (S)-S-oxide reductase
MIKITAIIHFCLILIVSSACSQNSPKVSNNKSKEEKNIKNMEGLEIATLGAGCFWCVEALYQDLKGVVKVESGYSGGTVENPTYKQVCDGNTGHAEVIRVIFDPKVISYDLIIELFWAAHDPTTLNRQGNDVGTQYRSAIFYHDEKQKEIALKSKETADKSGAFNKPIVTEISPLINYWPAEDYHQDYFNLNGDKNPYCSTVVAPKVSKFRKKYAHLLKD